MGLAVKQVPFLFFASSRFNQSTLLTEKKSGLVPLNMASLEPQKSKKGDEFACPIPIPARSHLPALDFQESCLGNLTLEWRVQPNRAFRFSERHLEPEIEEKGTSDIPIGVSLKPASLSAVLSLLTSLLFSGAEMNSSWAQNAWTEGTKTLLFMRVAFPDDPAEPISQDDASQLMNQVNSWYVANSYGKTAITTDVTPLLTLPNTKTWYGLQPPIQLLNDARAAALQNGFDTLGYDRDMVRFNSVPGWNFSGTSNIGAKGSWLQDSSLGVVVHELGHQYGLEHAGAWNAIGDSIIGPGSNSEYGNVFDAMGLPPPAPEMHDFNAAWKSRLNWLADRFVQTVTNSGTYRLRAFDVSDLESGEIYALKIRKDEYRDYWAEFRQKFNNNPWTQNGILLNWSPWSGSNRGTQLLDTTAGTPFGNDDAVLVVGRTFSDLEAGLLITPIAV